MSSKAATHPRRVAAALAAIAVTAVLHGSWLANVNGPQRAPAAVTPAV